MVRIASKLSYEYPWPVFTSLHRVRDAVRQAALMRFLQVPYAAERLAILSAACLTRGGLPQKFAARLLTPATKTFSLGRTIPEAVKRAALMQSRGPAVLLDYVEEMVETAHGRQQVFCHIENLLNAIGPTPLIHVPIKLTALVDPYLLERLSRCETLTAAEKKIWDQEASRVEALAKKASELGKVLLIDQEYPHQKKAIFDVGLRLMQTYNVDRPVVYMTIQAADVECARLLQQLAADVRIAEPAVKIVNGAYVSWARRHGYADSVQPSKMATFVHFALLAKFCLKRKFPLYMGTHNPLLEELADRLAAQCKPQHYLKGQLYGFQTKQEVQSLYGIFGPATQCVDYAVRRMMEGAGSKEAETERLLSAQEVQQLAEAAGLGERVTAEEYELICRAVRFDVQAMRQQTAVQTVRSAVRSAWKKV